MKAQRFDASVGNACGHRDPPGDVDVVTSPTLGLRVKTLDPFGLGDGDAWRRHPLGLVSLPSAGMFGSYLATSWWVRDDDCLIWRRGYFV